ncbi:unnamed protein product, partial [Owenia fusiformis]
ANVNHSDRNGSTPLMLCDDVNIMKLLLQHGADIQPVDCYGETALWRASQRNNYECVKELVENGTNVNHFDNYGRTPLMLCNDVNIMKLLLRHGADIQPVDCYGETALWRASQRNNYECVKELVENGTNVNHFDNYGRTPLMLCNHVDIMKLLLQHKANTEACVSDGKTVLLK